MALSPTMNIMLRAAEKAAKSLIRDFGEVEQLQVSRKGPGDFVSAADHRSEGIIFEELSKARSDFGFLMEERGKAGAKEYESRWIVDPLDGTTNFLHGIPHWNIAIALEEKGEIVAGIVYAPVINEMFRAEKGQGAFMRNKRLRVSGRNVMTDSVFLTGEPRRVPDEQSIFVSEYATVQRAGASLRRFGSAALDLAYVAAGRAEGFWERHLNPWDVAAGSIIVKEAGGLLSDIDGPGNPVQTGNIVAGNTSMHDELKKLLKSVKMGKDAA